MAVASKSLEAVQILIEYGADLELRDSSGSSPLHLASHEGLCDIVTCMIRAGAAVDAKNGTMCTPLIIAVTEGN